MKPGTLQERPGENRADDGKADNQAELFLQVLNHQRHDFMNDLQNLYGYIRLNKYDKLREFVENIKEKAARESAISKLGAPRLSFFLLSFRALKRNFRLDVAIGDDFSLSRLPLAANTIHAVGDMVITLLETIERHALPEPHEAVPLSLRLVVEDDALCVKIELTGHCDSRFQQAAESGLLPHLRQLKAALRYKVEPRFVWIELRVPFST